MFREGRPEEIDFPGRSSPSGGSLLLSIPGLLHSAPVEDGVENAEEDVRRTEAEDEASGHALGRNGPSDQEDHKAHGRHDHPGAHFRTTSQK